MTCRHCSTPYSCSTQPACGQRTKDPAFGRLPELQDEPGPAPSDGLRWVVYALFVVVAVVLAAKYLTG